MKNSQHKTRYKTTMIPIKVCQIFTCSNLINVVFKYF